MRKAIYLVVLLIFFTVVPGAFAAKRRSAAPPSTSASSSGCHTFGFVKAGLKASYLTTQASGNVTFTITYIFDNATQAKTTQKVTTPQATTDVETLIDVDNAGTLRGMKHLNIKTTTPVPILGSVTTETDIDFVPSLIAGPAGGWCTGETWTIPAVTETVTTKAPLAPPASQIVTTVASQGAVLSANETIGVPAGNFACVKYKGVIVANNNAQTAITWTSRDHGVVVRQDTLDGAGNVTSTTTLQSLQ
jgi:hypothetical protein